mmetsp:Transcript_38609/g.109185  ORF Transcript_38609/g.109185 Transcript_38609/m.109185 type:complete len:226 (-) Transcript_38609:103-780(-)
MHPHAKGHVELDVVEGHLQGIGGQHGGCKDEGHLVAHICRLKVGQQSLQQNRPCKLHQAPEDLDDTRHYEARQESVPQRPPEVPCRVGLVLGGGKAVLEDGVDVIRLVNRADAPQVLHVQLLLAAQPQDPIAVAVVKPGKDVGGVLRGAHLDRWFVSPALRSVGGRVPPLPLPHLRHLHAGIGWAVAFAVLAVLHARPWRRGAQAPARCLLNLGHVTIRHSIRVF